MFFVFFSVASPMWCCNVNDYGNNENFDGSESESGPSSPVRALPMMVVGPMAQHAVQRYASAADISSSSGDQFLQQEGFFETPFRSLPNSFSPRPFMGAQFLERFFSDLRKFKVIAYGAQKELSSNDVFCLHKEIKSSIEAIEAMGKRFNVIPSCTRCEAFSILSFLVRLKEATKLAKDLLEEDFNLRSRDMTKEFEALKLTNREKFESSFNFRPNMMQEFERLQLINRVTSTLTDEAYLLYHFCSFDSRLKLYRTVDGEHFLGMDVAEDLSSVVLKKREIVRSAVLTPDHFFQNQALSAQIEKGSVFLFPTSADESDFR